MWAQCFHCLIGRKEKHISHYEMNLVKCREGVSDPIGCSPLNDLQIFRQKLSETTAPKQTHKTSPSRSGSLLASRPPSPALRGASVQTALAEDGSLLQEPPAAPPRRLRAAREIRAPDSLHHLMSIKGKPHITVRPWQNYCGAK